MYVCVKSKQQNKGLAVRSDIDGVQLFSEHVTSHKTYEVLAELSWCVTVKVSACTMSGHTFPCTLEPADVTVDVKCVFCNTL